MKAGLQFGLFLYESHNGHNDTLLKASVFQVKHTPFRWLHVTNCGMNHVLTAWTTAETVK